MVNSATLFYTPGSSIFAIEAGVRELRPQRREFICRGGGVGRGVMRARNYPIKMTQILEWVRDNSPR